MSLGRIWEDGCARAVTISGPRITDSLDAAKLAICAGWAGTATVTANKAVQQTRHADADLLDAHVCP